MKDRDYYLKSRSSSYDLSPSEACPKAGRYWAKVWLSVRNNDGKASANKSYNDYEEYYPYTCVDRSRSEDLKASSDFKLADPIDRYTYKQLNVLVDVNDAQFKRIKAENDKMELRLYSVRDGQTYRVGKNKDYFINNANKSSFSFKIKDLCGDMNNFFDEIFGKEVTVTCRITVVNESGQRNPSFGEYNCPTERFICQ